jgi:hypothetical protein
MVFSVAQQPLVDRDLLIIEASWSRAPWSVGLLGTNDQPENTQHSQETDTHAAGGIWTHNPNSEWLQTHALVCADTGIGSSYIVSNSKYWIQTL